MPYRCERPLNRNSYEVHEEGRLDGILRVLAGLSHKKSRATILSGKVEVSGQKILDPAFRTQIGQRILVTWNAPHPRKTNPFGVRLVHQDPWLMVLDKPAGLLSTPTSAGEEETALSAARILGRGGGVVKAVHRLDRETSGLLVFARGVKTARLLRMIFDAHEIERVYYCVVQGVPDQPEGLISSMLMRDAGRGRRGSRRGSLRVRGADQGDPGPMPGRGRLAITRYRVVARDGRCSALEVKLKTGRTHQIRIHLSEIGCPIVGERVYGRVPGAPRQALHSGSMSFKHPVTKDRLHFSSPWPTDLAQVHPRGPRWSIVSH